MKAQPQITKIEFQKKNKNRVAVFLNDEFGFGLDAALVVKYNLKKGDILDEEKISQILLTEEKRRVKETAFRYLAGRAHSEKELRTKLLHKGYDEQLVLEVISDLKKQKYLDDLEFALAYARDRMLNKPMGERLLRRELWQKGINEAHIQKAIEEAYSKKEQAEFAKDLVKSRRTRNRDLEMEKRKKRLYDFLLRRGFDWDIAKEVIEQELNNF